MNVPYLSTEGLSVYRFPGGMKRALLEDVSISIHQGQILALVGESGSGKTTLAHAITGLFSRGTQIEIEGRVVVEGEELILSGREIYREWRRKIRYVFQEPWLALNPLARVRTQYRFALDAAGFSGKDHGNLIELFAQVGIDDVDRVLDAFPHQLSGGLAQRVMIALALLSSPKLLVADEPTSSLDAMHRLQILDLLRSLREKQGLAILLVTHDFEIARCYADVVAVLYAGRIREMAPVTDFFHMPLHPYSQALVQWRSTSTTNNMKVVESDLDLHRAESHSGCRFHNRCPKVEDDCLEREPSMQQINAVRQVRCLHWKF